MVELGALYYGQRSFDLALKYYEMAARKNNPYAISDLGYIWYYGRTGERDYEKAYLYFKRAAEMGDASAQYKLADMYRNGYFVEKDEAKYRDMIEELYVRFKTAYVPDPPVPEVYTRLAGIRAEEGRTAEALALYGEARKNLSYRIRLNPFFGNLNIMRRMIGDIYRLKPFDSKNFSLYDLYYVLAQPARVRFLYAAEPYEVRSVEEDGGVVVSFDGKWYRTAGQRKPRGLRGLEWEMS